MAASPVDYDLKGSRANPCDSKSADFHPGIDIANSYGSKIYAFAKGTVILSGYYSGYGNAVILNHHNGLETLYGHTSKILVSKGQEVEKGQLIALEGSSGRSTGLHVHFEVRKNGTPVSPMGFIKGVK